MFTLWVDSSVVDAKLVFVPRSVVSDSLIGVHLKLDTKLYSNILRTLLHFYFDQQAG